MPGPEIGANPYRELAWRFLITFLLGVVVYRFGIVVPVPDLDLKAVKEAVLGISGAAGAGEQVNVLDRVLRMANMFNGGALATASIFGLGVMPYISASIILQLLTFSVPSLKALQKEGEVGRRKINQYTRYLTLVICMVQAFFSALMLYNSENHQFVPPGVSMVGFIAQSVLVVTTGSMILLWLAECITKFGVGNGVSVVIMIGILASFPVAIQQTAQSATVDLLPVLLGLLLLFLIIIAAMVVITQARRVLNLEQQRRVQGGRQYGGGQTKLPLMLNHAGVIPVIFSQPILIVLGFCLSWLGVAFLADPTQPGYRYIFAAMIIFFTFFYISITVDLNEWANNFRQGGFFIRGVKPGKNTADYLHFRLLRLTFVGALSLACITIVPPMLGALLGLPDSVSQTLLGGIGLLIVVGVALDVIQKVSSYLLAHQYQGLISRTASESSGTGKKPKLAGNASGAKRF